VQIDVEVRKRMKPMTTEPYRRLRRNDARGAARFPLTAPVTFSWVDGGETYKGEGVTKDLCAGSLFIWSEDAPPLGIPVQCHVFLPGANVAADWSDMSVDGRIARIEEHSSKHYLLGFVVINHRISVTADRPAA